MNNFLEGIKNILFVYALIDFEVCYGITYFSIIGG
jgi:hypothetical protein